MTERESEGLEGDQQINIVTETSLSVRPSFTVQHLWTARRAAWLCSQREQHLINEGHTNVDREHRAQAVTAVFTAFAFVESFVNDVIDRQQLQVGNRTNPIQRCQDALAASSLNKLDLGRDPGQSFDVVGRLRNALTHYTPEWEHDFINSALSRELTKRLRGRENRQPIAEPWFPNRALGAGCASWAIDTSVGFAKQWHTAMGLTSDFDSMYIDWNEPPVDKV